MGSSRAAVLLSWCACVVLIMSAQAIQLKDLQKRAHKARTESIDQAPMESEAAEAEAISEGGVSVPAPPGEEESYLSHEADDPNAESDAALFVASMEPAYNLKTRAETAVRRATCIASEFGCCRDGVTPALGPKFDGCLDSVRPPEPVKPAQIAAAVAPVVTAVVQNVSVANETSHQPTCPEGEEYAECGSSCPATCDNPAPVCIQKCTSGCFCVAPKLRLANGNCDYVTRCPVKLVINGTVVNVTEHSENGQSGGEDTDEDSESSESDSDSDSDSSASDSKPMTEAESFRATLEAHRALMKTRVKELLDELAKYQQQVHELEQQVETYKSQASQATEELRQYKYEQHLRQLQDAVERAKGKEADRKRRRQRLLREQEDSHKADVKAWTDKVRTEKIEEGKEKQEAQRVMAKKQQEEARKKSKESSRKDRVAARGAAYRAAHEAWNKISNPAEREKAKDSWQKQQAEAEKNDEETRKKEEDSAHKARQTQEEEEGSKSDLQEKLERQKLDQMEKRAEEKDKSIHDAKEKESAAKRHKLDAENNMRRARQRAIAHEHAAEEAKQVASEAKEKTEESERLKSMFEQKLILATHEQQAWAETIDEEDKKFSVAQELMTQKKSTEEDAVKKHAYLEQLENSENEKRHELIRKLREEGTKLERHTREQTRKTQRAARQKMREIVRERRTKADEKNTKTAQTKFATSMEEEDTKRKLETDQTQERDAKYQAQMAKVQEDADKRQKIADGSKQAQQEAEEQKTKALDKKTDAAAEAGSKSIEKAHLQVEEVTKHLFLSRRAAEQSQKTAARATQQEEGEKKLVDEQTTKTEAAMEQVTKHSEDEASAQGSVNDWKAKEQTTKSDMQDLKKKLEEQTRHQRELIKYHELRVTQAKADNAEMQQSMKTEKDLLQNQLSSLQKQQLDEQQAKGSLTASQRKAKEDDDKRALEKRAELSESEQKELVQEENEKRTDEAGEKSELKTKHDNEQVSKKHQANVHLRIAAGYESEQRQKYLHARDLHKDIKDILNHTGQLEAPSQHKPKSKKASVVDQDHDLSHLMGFGPNNDTEESEPSEQHASEQSSEGGTDASVESGSHHRRSAHSDDDDDEHSSSSAVEASAPPEAPKPLLVSPAPETWNYRKKGSDWTGTCALGKQQSPVNIQTEKDVAKTVGNSTLELNYVPSYTPLRVVHNGHALQVTGDFGFVIWKNDKYKTLQLHFHSPSEHSIDGLRYDMEMHIVHQKEGAVGLENLLVVSVFFRNGGLRNKFLNSLGWDRLPGVAGTFSTIGEIIDLNAADLKLGKAEFFQYQGSLDTPPCTESVTYFIDRFPAEMSWDQAAAIDQLFSENSDFAGGNGNIRAAQALNGRIVNLVSAHNLR